MNGDTINPWTIGVARQGNGPAVPHERPQHRLTVTRESTEEIDDYYLTFDQASAERIKRLKEAGVPHKVTRRLGCHLIIYTDPVSGDQITLTYVEWEAHDGALV